MRLKQNKVKSVLPVIATTLLPPCFLKVGRGEWTHRHRIHVEHQGGCGCLTGENGFWLKCMLLVPKPMRTGFIHSFTHSLGINCYSGKVSLVLCLCLLRRVHWLEKASSQEDGTGMGSSATEGPKVKLGSVFKVCMWSLQVFYKNGMFGVENTLVVGTHPIYWFEKKWVLVVQTCLTFCDPMECSPPSSSVHGILQITILEWVAIPFSRESSWSRDQTQVSCFAGRSVTIWASREAPSIDLRSAKCWCVLSRLEKHDSNLQALSHMAITFSTRFYNPACASVSRL